MKKALTIAFIVFIGFSLISSVWNDATEVGEVGNWYYLVWSIGAIAIGVFAAFFAPQFNKGNAERFEKLYERTKFPLFRKMAEGTLAEDQKIVTTGVGIIFIVIGLIMFYRYAPIVWGS